ncbi:MAG: hypothetical protein HY913_09395 [Desulfomonile tiedjei]|nr:hypothetical protein [Desulfomonile tiedjei]
MRPVLAVLIWVALVGGLSAYMHAREKINPARSYEVRAVTEPFALEVTTTFDLEPDPFALKTETESEAPALLVRVNGKEALRRNDRVERGVPFRLEPVPGLVQGHNEIYLEANPPVEQADRSLAVRVRVFRGSMPVADQSIWSEAGSTVATTFRVDIEPEKTPEADTHGH